MLGNAPIGKLLFKLSVPTVAAQLVNLLYNIVDRIYIGHMPEVGSLALTGVGVCLPIIIVVSAFAALAGSGGAPRSSIFMGRGDKESAEKTMGACACLLIIVSLVLTGLLLVFGKRLLLSFGASENTIEYASAYLSVYACGTLFVQLTLGMNAYITAQGFTSVSMKTVLIGALLNIILDPLFIFVFDMGVVGAALATVISQAVSCLWVLRFLTGGKTVLRLRKAHLRLDRKLLPPCVALGLAPFIMQSSESIISVAFNSSLLQYGGDLAVGAMTILSSVMQFAMMPPQGFAQGAQPILSYNFGARNAARVKKTLRLLIAVCLSYSVALWVAIMLRPQFFVSLFTSDAALLPYAAAMLRVYYAGMIFFGIQMACQMTFISLGNAKASITVAIVRKFVLILPLIYIMPRLVSDKVTGVFLAEPISDFSAVVFTAILFFFQFRKAMRSIENEQHKVQTEY